MIKVFLTVLTVLLAISGLCELIYSIRLFFLAPSVKTQGYVIVFLNENTALEQLKYIYEKQKWNGEGYAAKIIAITDNIFQTEYIICENFSIDKNIFLSKLKDVETILREIC